MPVLVVTVTGNIQTCNAIPIAGEVEVMLCGYGSWVPRADGQTLIGQIQSPKITANATDGSFSFQVPPNNVITPDGTYYTVTIKDANGDVSQINAYRFFASGVDVFYDLNTTDPINPNFPPPPLPPFGILIVLPPSPGMVFDGLLFSSFKTTLNVNVTAPVFRHMVPGNLYTFIIQQNGTGGFTFAWPANVHNAVMVDPTASGGTIQTFVADESGDLWPIGPGTYYA